MHLLSHLCLPWVYPKIGILANYNPARSWSTLSRDSLLLKLHGIMMPAGKWLHKKTKWVSIKTLKLHIYRSTVKTPDKIPLIIFLQGHSKAWVLTILTISFNDTSRAYLMVDIWGVVPLATCRGNCLAARVWNWQVLVFRHLFPSCDIPRRITQTPATLVLAKSKHTITDQC